MRDTDRDAYRQPFSDSDGIGNTWDNCLSNATFTNSNCNIDSNFNSYGNNPCDSVANPYCNGYGYSHSYSDIDCHSQTNPDAEICSNAQAAPYAATAPITLP